MLTFQPTSVPAPILKPANDGIFASRAKPRFISVKYTLQNGVESKLLLMNRSTSDAIIHVLDLFGEHIKSCSAKVL